MPSKPTILLVPGAWHLPSAYAPLTRALEAASYEVVASVHPSIDSASGSASADADAARALLLPLLEDGKSVIVLAHSYGGVPAGGAAYGLDEASWRSSRKGQGGEGGGGKGGVVGLVYVCAHVVPEGQSLVGHMGGPSKDVKIEPTEPEGCCIPTNGLDVFYNDMADAGLAAEMNRELRPQAMAAFGTPAPPQAWAQAEFDGRRVYVRSTADAAVPPAIQDDVLRRSGVAWDVVDVDAGHSVLASRPEEVLAVIEKRFCTK